MAFAFGGATASGCVYLKAGDMEGAMVAVMANLLLVGPLGYLLACFLLDNDGGKKKRKKKWKRIQRSDLTVSGG